MAVFSPVVVQANDAHTLIAHKCQRSTTLYDVVRSIRRQADKEPSTLPRSPTLSCWPLIRKGTFSVPTVTWPSSSQCMHDPSDGQRAMVGALEDLAESWAPTCSHLLPPAPSCSTTKQRAPKKAVPQEPGSTVFLTLTKCRCLSPCRLPLVGARTSNRQQASGTSRNMQLRPATLIPAGCYRVQSATY